MPPQRMLMYLRAGLHGQTKDPQVNLSQIIPLRLYGDGAESQRYLFDVSFLMQLSVLYDLNISK